jgi:F-type H+-transporting ATPase subunit b
MISLHRVRRFIARRGVFQAVLGTWLAVCLAASTSLAQDQAGASGKSKVTPEAPAEETKAKSETSAAQVAPSAKPGASAKSAPAGAHDATDLGHQNASRMLEDPSQWKSDLAIGTLLVFLGLLALLTKFAWRPIMDGLEGRERAIAANIEEARRSAEAAAEQLRQYEARLAAATEEAREIINQARKDADSARERIMADAHVAAQRERQRAVDDISAAKNVALREITQKSVDLAMALASRVVRRQLSREDHAELIREVLDQFPSRN